MSPKSEKKFKSDCNVLKYCSGIVCSQIYFSFMLTKFALKEWFSSKSFVKLLTCAKILDNMSNGQARKNFHVKFEILSDIRGVCRRPFASSVSWAGPIIYKMLCIVVRIKQQYCFKISRFHNRVRFVLILSARTQPHTKCLNIFIDNCRDCMRLCFLLTFYYTYVLLFYRK